MVKILVLLSITTSLFSAEIPGYEGLSMDTELLEIELQEKSPSRREFNAILSNIEGDCSYNYGSGKAFEKCKNKKLREVLARK